MKITKQVGLYAAVIVAGMMVLAYTAFSIEQSRKEKANIRHDAEWFFQSLVIGNEVGAALHLQYMAMSPEELAKALKSNGKVIADTEFSDLDVTYEYEDGVRLAVLKLEDDVVIRLHQAQQGREHWTIYDIQ